jgi:NADH:ubiquinone oxidoreductase subunit 5 (subunit L)/multisubunit Na+/H+ antiporter MnhA subunit
MPVTATLFLVGGATIAAFPALCGFVSEWLLLQAMLHGLPSRDPTLALALPVGVGALALTGGLTALTFVKAAGIGLLGQARSDQAERATEVHRAQSVGTGILAALCLLFGVAPFLAIPAVIDAARTVTGSRVRAPLAGDLEVGLAGFHGILAPGLLALGLAVAVAVVASARRLAQRTSVRRTEAWGCGRELQSARMQYTATSFGEPLTRVFEDVLSPSRDLDVSPVAESRYYVEAATFHTSLDDAFERHAYRPIAGLLAWWGSVARRIPNGNIHRYLAFALGALIVVLVVLG